MADRPSPLNVYWTEPTKLAFEQIRSDLASQGLRLSRTQLAEFAVSKFAERYARDVRQLAFDLRVERKED